MTFSVPNIKRVDADPDPWSKQRGRVQEPRRAETGAVVRNTGMAERMRVVVTRSGNKSINDVTLTPIDWDVEIADASGLHDTVTNNTRLTMPSTGRVTGLWLIHGHVTWDDNNGAGTAGPREVWLRKNGTTVIAQDFKYATGVGSALSHDVLFYDNDPQLGDYYELLVFQQSGGALSVFVDSAAKTYFELIHLW